MRFHAEYTWLESYLDNDAFWLEDVLTWDETFQLLISDYDVFSFLTSPFFVNTHFFLDSITKMSFLDLLLFSESDSYNESRELFDFVMWDYISFLNNTLFSSQLLFYTNYQDFITVTMHHSPELVLALVTFADSYWFKTAINYVPSAVFDIFSDSLAFALSEFVEYAIMFMGFIWLVIFFSNFFRHMNWNNSIESNFVRIQYWLFGTSKEARLQFEAALKLFFCVFLYTSMMLATFDDDQEEFIEFFDNFLLNLFLSLFGYFIYKSSIHYLAFLEASVSEGRSLSFALKQFLRDVINNFAFILRFCTLMIRLNIYDANDDILDSYYIFLGDFDDDEYFSDLIFSMFSLLFFDTDNNDDRSFFLEDEVDFSIDLFSLYFIVWGKLSLFIFFIIEEIARVALALYITYLIIFEVHSVNKSYVEDGYFTSKRFSFLNSNFLKILSNI